MATSSERPIAPYAPLGNVLTVIRRLRERGIPVPVTKDTLTVLGIPEGNAPRTLQALKLLGLVAEDGGLSAPAERLRRASTDEYPETLAEVIREAYAPVFAVVDPATDTEVRVSDAFRQFDPATQRGRMVTLFLGLCAEAGIAPVQRTPRASREASGRRSPARSNPARPSRASAQTIGPRAIPSGEAVGQPRLENTIFPVLEQDLALLDDQQFAALWSALGTVARLRAKANQERANRSAPDLLGGFFTQGPPHSEETSREDE
jgi:hypothetical protein